MGASGRHYAGNINIIIGIIIVAGTMGRAVLIRRGNNAPIYSDFQWRRSQFEYSIVTLQAGPLEAVDL